MEDKEGKEWIFKDYQLEVGVDKFMPSNAMYFAKFKNGPITISGSTPEEAIYRIRSWFLKYKNKYQLPNPNTNERFKPITNFELIYLTFVLSLIQIKASEECLIINFEIIDDQYVKGDFIEYYQSVLGEDNYKILSFFESVICGNLEIKIHGKNVENWKVGIEQRYLDRKPIYLEISNNEIVFYEFHGYDGGSTDMTPVEYESFEISKI